MNRVLLSTSLPSGLTVSLVQGDITAEAVDAIVNAANSRLSHGGGVAGAISRKGGPAIQTESDAWVRVHGLVDHGKPAVTGAGDLPCKAVIHAVGPVWGGGGEDAKLRAAVLGALGAAAQRGFTSVSLPAISTGIFGFPRERAARVIWQAVADFAAGSSTSLREIRVTILDDPTAAAFRGEFEARWK